MTKKAALDLLVAYRQIAISEEIEYSDFVA